MKESSRIILNIVASYGRSLFMLLCGLFTGRWLLMALGETDYGLYGVIGGLTAFISFLNNLLAVSIGRFYAIAVGEARVSADGVEICRKWFNTAFLMHTVVAVLLIVIGYPLGVHAITHEWLRIPADRIQSCVWVFRFVCISCFAGMLAVPCNAMYTAKQRIAELTVYSFVTMALNVCVLYYAVNHPGDWLVAYSVCACILTFLPQIIIAFRAVRIFPECRIRKAFLFAPGRIWEVCRFSLSLFVGGLGYLFKDQGMIVLVNRVWGVRVNAAMTFGNTISSHCSALSGSLEGAFSPAIMNAYGEGDFEKMRVFAFRSCRLGTLLVLLFAIPLSLEIHEILRLWLVTPPAYTAELCMCVLAAAVIEKTAGAHPIVIGAYGRVAASQITSGLTLMSSIPLAWLMFHCGVGVCSIGFALILSMILNVLGRIVFARRLAGLSARYWLRHVVLPLFVLAALSVGIGLLPRLWMTESFLRVCVTTIFSGGTLLPLAWFAILTSAEREVVVQRLRWRRRPAELPE